ncbi:MAG TPA: hypothetical protein VH008_25620 [Pseudonocardia sp.]|nr:hypothetical protein [Pseudonocardia sp.]
MALHRVADQFWTPEDFEVTAGLYRGGPARPSFSPHPDDAGAS